MHFLNILPFAVAPLLWPLEQPTFARCSFNKEEFTAWIYTSVYSCVRIYHVVCLLLILYQSHCIYTAKKHFWCCYRFSPCAHWYVFLNTEINTQNSSFIIPRGPAIINATLLFKIIFKSGLIELEISFSREKQTDTMYIIVHLLYNVALQNVEIQDFLMIFDYLHTHKVEFQWYSRNSY